MRIQRLGAVIAILVGGCSSGGDPPGAQDTKAPAIAFVDQFPAVRFDAPVALAFAPGDRTTLYVVEQAGRVRAIANTRGTATSRVFLDLTDRVLAGGELGLLGLAFDPQFAANGRIYVNYTADAPRRTIISRFDATATAADPDSETVLLTYEQPFANHNGGALAFGPDGMLYIGSGDGGSGNDPLNHAQRLDTPLGKVLRIAADGSVPADNPFRSTPAARPEIWAFGLRNPWRMTFDRGSGALWAGDVGQSAREEIDVIERGGNYGWKLCEGTLCTGAAPPGHIPPVFEYGRDEGTTVIGGYVYRGAALPELRGRYLFADFGSNRVWALVPGGRRDELGSVESPTSFGEDAAGELYVASYGGAVFAVVPTSP